MKHWENYAASYKALIGVQGIAAIILALFLISIPIWLRDIYYLRIVNMIGISILLTLSFNLLMGFTGQISLGQAGFYGVGAYVSALLAIRLGIPFWLTLPIAGIAGGLVGIMIGPVLRLRGHGLAMATFFFGEIVRILLVQWKSVTGGPIGITSIPYPHFGNWVLNTHQEFFYLILSAVIINYLVVFRVVDSRVGRAMQAIRDNQEAAEIVGVNATRYKVMAFMIAGFFSGVAGSLYAHMTSFISPENFDILKSAEILTMVVVGGVGSLIGPVIGAVVIVLLPEQLRVFQEYRLILFGGLILIILNFTPRGLAGICYQAVERFSKRGP